MSNETDYIPQCGKCGGKLEIWESQVTLCSDCYEQLLHTDLNEDQRAELYRDLEKIKIRIYEVGNRFWKNYNPIDDLKILTNIQELILGDYKPKKNPEQCVLDFYEISRRY